MSDITVVNLPAPAITVVQPSIGLQGPPGPPAGAAAISADADNRLALGSDNKLYVPDALNPDPLAYYILAKS